MSGNNLELPQAKAGQIFTEELYAKHKDVPMEKRRPLVQLAPVPTSRSDQILPDNLVTRLGLL